MSSYLSFYLVPKKTKAHYVYNENGGTEEEVEITKGEPLLFTSYSRSTEVYQAYNETLHPAYIGNIEGGEAQYTEITYDDALRVVEEYKREIADTERRLEIDYKMLKANYHEDLYEDIMSMENYLKDQKEALQLLISIADWIDECCNVNNDFEKVLINID